MISFSDEIKKIRQSCFLSQEAFAKEIRVSFSSVNRWEGGRTVKAKYDCHEKSERFLRISQYGFQQTPRGMDANREGGLIVTPEESARKLIDTRLSQSGWILQDLRNVNPMASLGIAVREYAKRHSTGGVEQL